MRSPLGAVAGPKPAPANFERAFKTLTYVYVNVNLCGFVRAFQLGEAPLTLRFDVVKFLQGDFDITLLLAQQRPPLIDFRQKVLKLPHFPGLGIVHIEHFVDFGEREAEPFASQH